MDERTLDRQIAERQGLTLRTIPPYTDWNTTDHEMFSWGNSLWNANIDKALPYYTTDLNTAWQLTEPYFFKLVPLYTGAGKVGCIAELSEGEKIGNGRADTPAMAICLAYLELTATGTPHAGEA